MCTKTLMLLRADYFEFGLDVIQFDPSGANVFHPHFGYLCLDCLDCLYSLFGVELLV